LLTTAAHRRCITEKAAIRGFFVARSTRMSFWAQQRTASTLGTDKPRHVVNNVRWKNARTDRRPAVEPHSGDSCDGYRFTHPLPK